MSPAEQCRIDPAVVAALYVRHADELRAFLLGMLRDPHLAADVLQSTFAKSIEQGHTAQETSLKAWLFQVAYHEAMLVRRRGAIQQRATQTLTERGARADTPPAAAAADPAGALLRWETVAAVRAAVEALPAEQREVVRLRIWEGRKFADIAAQLGLPLGTVLSRMQLALKKLRARWKDEP